VFWADNSLRVLVLALLVDALIGDPDSLWKRAPHPVVMFGWVIDRLDAALNNERWTDARRRAAGVLAVVMLVMGSAALGWLIQRVLHALPLGWIIEAIAASVFIAQRSLYEHVARVQQAFASGGLTDARRAVGAIVGRDPQALDAAGVCRAAIETTAENFSDGVVAPALWFALLGLPGLLAYKAINTADSMTGHLTERHRAFGWAAARLDDLVNLVPARLSALLLALVAPVTDGSIAGSLRVALSDAQKHRSPNAGWPESAMAAALGVALAGPRVYPGRTVNDPFVNASGRKDATPDDIGRALGLFVAACALEGALYAALAFVV
jgi:adenosylcobinamide-phosphate synthase